MNHTMKRTLRTLLIVVFFVCITFGTGIMTVYAKKMTVYNEVLKKGSTVYCAVGGETSALYKVDIRTGKVQKLYSDTTGEISGICAMTLKRGYIYFEECLDMGVSLYRIKTNGKGKKMLASWGLGAGANNFYYEISGSWIYYNDARPSYGKRVKSKKMKLNGKRRKKIKKHRIKTRSKQTNASGYRISYIRANRFYDKEMEEYYYAYNCYLLMPKRKIFLYKDYNYHYLAGSDFVLSPESWRP